MSNKKLVVQQKIIDDTYVDLWVWQIIIDDTVVKKSGESKTLKEAYETAKEQLAKIK